MNLDNAKEEVKRYVKDLETDPMAGAAMLGALTVFNSEVLKPTHSDCAEILTKAIASFTEVRTAFETKQGKVTLSEQARFQDSIVDLLGVVGNTDLQMEKTSVSNLLQEITKADIDRLLKEIFNK